MSCFNCWDKPGLKALSRCPGWSTKTSWLGIQSGSIVLHEYQHAMISLFNQLAEDLVLLF